MDGGRGIIGVVTERPGRNSRRMDSHGRARYGGDRRESLMTVKDVARQLRVSESTVRRLVSSGDLAVARLGGVIRFSPTSVDELISGATTPQTTKARG
jgi:excisionase family DNA binding protein